MSELSDLVHKAFAEADLNSYFEESAKNEEIEKKLIEDLTKLMQKKDSRYENTSRVEIWAGRLYVTRQIEGLEAPYTKWDFLSNDEREAYANHPFVDGNISCSQCGEKLATEADFAKHFVVTDVRYFNLGECPN